jgi:hypothetical protein
MTNNAIVRRRNLPHVDVDGKPYFITACLHGGINAAGLKRIKTYREDLAQRVKPEKYDDLQWKRIQDKLVFKLVDSILDGEPSANYLSDERLAEVVQNAFLHFADQRYQLFAFVVMPSHHHWVFLPLEEWGTELAMTANAKPAGKNKQRTPREVISHSIQSFTGTRCNQLLNRSGPFWQNETYDHFARNEEELVRIISYVEQNPVVAGLVDNAEDYSWSSTRLRKRLRLEMGEPIPGI